MAERGTHWGMSTHSTWDESAVVRNDDGRFAAFLNARSSVDLGEGIEGEDAARFAPGELIEERSQALEEGGYVPALAEGAYTNPRARGGASQVSMWWDSRNMQGEWSDDGTGYEKMPDDWTPQRTAGAAVSGRRRTYRRFYEGAGVSLRMPSASSIRSFSETQQGKSFDVPVEGDFEGGSVSGWVRCTRTDDGVWITEGLGFAKDQQQVAEAVSAVLESRRPTKALSGWQSMDERRADRMRRAGAQIRPVGDSSFIKGIGVNPFAGVTFTKIRDEVYTNEVVTNVRDFAASESKGQIYNSEIQTQRPLGKAQVCEKCSGAYHPSFGAHICLRAGHHAPTEVKDEHVEKRRRSGSVFAGLRAVLGRR